MPKADPEPTPAEPVEAAPKLSAGELRERYVLPISDETVAALDQSGVDLTEWARSQAAGLYPQIADLVGQGVEPRLLLDGYRQVAAQELEREVGFDDPVFRDAVVSQQMATLDQFRNYVRSLPEWDETDAAEREAQRLISSVEGL